MTNETKKKKPNYEQRDKRVEIRHELSSREKKLSSQYKNSKTRREKNRLFIKGVKWFGW